MENENYQVKHEIYVGYLNGSELNSAFQIGHALKEEQAGYYVLRLWPLPGTVYYLAKNYSGDRYTVFAKKVATDTGVKFQNPIGFAHLCPEIKEYIEIFLRFPRQRIFMSLFPAK